MREVDVGPVSDTCVGPLSGFALGMVMVMVLVGLTPPAIGNLGLEKKAEVGRVVGGWGD